MKRQEKHEPYCGCAECKPVYELRHLLGMLERQQKPVNQAEVETGEWPVVAPQEQRPAAAPPDGGR